MLKRSHSSSTVEPAAWPVPTLIGGMLLLLLAPWVANMIPTSAVWSDEDAQEYTRASADLHARSYEAAAHEGSNHGHSHTGGTAEEKAAAQTAFDKIQSRRDSASRLPSVFKYLLQTLGIAACAAGVWGYVQNKRRER